ncbi:CAP domain-containing protein [Lactiplantibacillus garii]|nr:CAP domain-containing protein [Lactiplantibacillus garii]
MTNKLLKLGLTSFISLGILGMGYPQNAQASATYKRTKTVKTGKAAYYSTSNASTVQFKGSSKKLRLKANHKLNSYKKSTWTRTKKTTVAKHGKKYLYYYVTSAKDGVTGWVWSHYLKHGKNYQMTNPKTIAVKSYVRAKPGKIYQLNGNNNYMTFGKGISLSSKQTYKATQKRYVYKQGKRHTYYCVTSSKGVEGWVNSSLVKVGSYKKVTRTTIKHKVTTTNKPSKTAKSVNPDKTYNAVTVAQNMTSLINNYRIASGRAAVKYNTGLEQLGNKRAVQLENNFSHYDENGNNYAIELAKQMNLMAYFGGEDCTTAGFETTNMALAKQLVNNYKNSPEHWNDIMDGSNGTIGIGLNLAKDGTIYNAAELGF